MAELGHDRPEQETAGRIVVGDEDLHLRPSVATISRAARTRMQLCVELIQQRCGVVELAPARARSLQAGADVGQTRCTDVRTRALEGVGGALDGVPVTVAQLAVELGASRRRSR